MLSDPPRVLGRAHGYYTPENRRGLQRTSAAHPGYRAAIIRNQATGGPPRGAQAQFAAAARACAVAFRRSPSLRAHPTAEWEERACAGAPLGLSAQPNSRSRGVRLPVPAVQNRFLTWF